MGGIEERGLGNPPRQGRSKVEDQALSFRTQHYLCRQEVALAGSQQLRAQDPVPARRCETEGEQGLRDRNEEMVTG